MADRGHELLDLIGLPQEMGKRYPNQLSGGQRQRVGVARALAADPPLMLMDEPFGAIDPINRDRLQNEFLRLQAQVKKTVVFVTHDIDEAIKMGDRIAILREGGTLVQYDSPDAILATPAERVRRAVRRRGPRPQTALARPGRRHRPGSRARRKHQRQGVDRFHRHVARRAVADDDRGHGTGARDARQRGHRAGVDRADQPGAERGPRRRPAAAEDHRRPRTRRRRSDGRRVRSRRRSGHSELRRSERAASRRTRSSAGTPSSATGIPGSTTTRPG